MLRLVFGPYIIFLFSFFDGVGKIGDECDSNADCTLAVENSDCDFNRTCACLLGYSVQDANRTCKKRRFTTSFFGL